MMHQSGYESVFEPRNGVVAYVPGGPLDHLATWGHGQGVPPPVGGEREQLSPGQPPWEPEKPSTLTRLMPFFIVLGMLLLLLALFGVIAQRTNTLPQWVPLIGKDTGVAACEAIANQGNLRGVADQDGAGPGTRMTESEYRQIRDIFADSRYPSIRDNGTRMADYAWQLQAIGADKDAEAALAALPLLQPMTQAYAGLAGGCADHGYTIPALGS
jgi:Spy/CpxP family protein refolding chaperone